jgi:hypothetical protein
VLDQLEATESKLQPKSAAQSPDVERTGRHPSLEDLESYANGRLASSRLSYCQSHLESCEACRAELEDLRSFASEASGFPSAQPNRFGADRRKRRSGLTVHLSAAIATILVAAVGAGLWWAHATPRANHTAAAPSGAKSPGASQQASASIATAAPVAATPSVTATPPVARIAGSKPTTSPALTFAARAQPRDTPLADDLAALPDDVRPAVATAIQLGKLQLPTDVGRSHGRTEAHPATSATDTAFALLGPFGEAISDTRPQFSWQPVAGAIRYSVTIVDTGLHPVQRSPRLRKTVWRPRRPLRRGGTYLWQVTATLRGGAKVVASRPSPSETQLRIIPIKLADELARFQRGHKDAHLVLGTLYAQAGMLTDSAMELKQVQPGDPSYNTARTLLQSLSSANPYDVPGLH